MGWHGGSTEAFAIGPIWIPASVLESLTVGTAFSFNLDTICASPQGKPLTYTLLSGSLPAGITQSGTRGQTLSGTPTATGTSTPVFQADDSAVITGGTNGDWASRSTAAGVVLAVALNKSSDLTTYAFAGSETVSPVLDTAQAPLGQPASIKFTVDPSDGPQCGTLRIPFGTTFGNGSEVWVSHRERMPPEFAYLVCPTSDNSVQGFKQAIISGPSSSNQAFENVWESNENMGGVLGYNNSNAGFNNWAVGYTAATGFDFRFQPFVGNDGSGSVSPDSIYSTVNGGTDPDTGSTFSASQVEWARIGGSYNSQQDAAFAYGLGHPLSGAVRYPVNQWATFTYCIDVGTFGTASSRIRAWVAPEGQPYVKLVDNANVELDIGTGNDGGFGCVWPMPYYTNRVAGGVSVASRTNNITGVTVRVVGLGTAVGAGTLSWNATTKKLTWTQHGGTAGTGRGVSAWKRFVNCFTGSGVTGYGGGQYLGLEITNFAGLPSTNQTDTITIQSGRLSTQTNKAEVIVSSQPINATAFNSAGVQIGPTGGYAPT